MIGGNWYQPALMTSTPVGYQRSPGLNSSSTVLFGSVRKYSPSSTCVPSDSSTRRTGSEAGTPSFSRPNTTQINTLQRNWSNLHILHEKKNYYLCHLEIVKKLLLESGSNRRLIKVRSLLIN